MWDGGEWMVSFKNHDCPYVKIDTFEWMEGLSCEERTCTASCVETYRKPCELSHCPFGVDGKVLANGKRGNVK